MKTLSNESGQRSDYEERRFTKANAFLPQNFLDKYLAQGSEIDMSYLFPIC